MGEALKGPVKVNLAWRNLLHSKARMAVALGAVVFTVVLLFFQIGNYAAIQKTATMVYDRLRFDIVIISPAYVQLTGPGRVPRSTLNTALAVEGVERAMPLSVAEGTWRNPVTRLRHRIAILAYRVTDPVFDVPEIEENADLLKREGNVFLDTQTRRFFGPQTVGQETEANAVKVKVAGRYTIGTGFSAFGELVTSERTFNKLFPTLSKEDMSLGLIIVKPGVDPEVVAKKLAAAVPPSARVLTRPALLEQERTFWTVQTNIGIVLVVGVAVALLIGLIVLYQLLAAEVLNHLHEYATLKAIGYRNSFLTKVVVQTAAILAGLAFIPGVAFSIGVYWYVRETAYVPVDMTVPRLVVVFALINGLSMGSALLTVRKAKSSDPAELF